MKNCFHILKISVLFVLNRIKSLTILKLILKILKQNCYRSHPMFGKSRLLTYIFLPMNISIFLKLVFCWRFKFCHYLQIMLKDSPVHESAVANVTNEWLLSGLVLEWGSLWVGFGIIINIFDLVFTHISLHFWKNTTSLVTCLVSPKILIQRISNMEKIINNLKISVNFCHVHDKQTTS